MLSDDKNQSEEDSTKQLIEIVDKIYNVKRSLNLLPG